MVKLNRFDIEFTNPEQAYFAGQEVAGKIVIENSEAKRLNEILLEIKGRAKTYWTKHSGKSRRHCSCSEPYFCEQFNTRYTHKFSGEEGEQQDNGSTKRSTYKERILPAGLHEIPFSYTLPKTLPSSFEGEFGYVRYTCRAIVERPWDFDIVSRRAFTVIGIEDNNEESQALQPSTASNSMQHTQLWCIRQGEVGVQMNLDRSGYTPGETILLSGHIHNQSSRLLKGFTVKLVQHVNYKAKTFSGVDQTKQTSKCVGRVEGGEVQPQSMHSLHKEKLVIPSITPRLSKCKIIEISYTLELEAQSSAKTSLPVTIGTIPLLSDILSKIKNASAPATSDQQNPAANGLTPAPEISLIEVTITDESGTTRITTAEENLDTESEALISAKKRVRMPSSILSELYPSMPSPYYKESCFGKTNIADEERRNQYGENNFAPKYPFYSD